MGNDREALKNLSEERVTFPEEMAVTDHVWEALAEMVFPLVPTGENRYDAFCARCDQPVFPVERKGVKYAYSIDQMNGLKLAHMIQTHGWTRETPNAEQ